jgi:hypothetical protein
MGCPISFGSDATNRWHQQMQNTASAFIAFDCPVYTIAMLMANLGANVQV